MEVIMNITLEMDNWIVNDEYFITTGVYEYEVYSCETDEDEAKELFSSSSFEECLVWIWNSL
jgi:hypothetical protein